MRWPWESRSLEEEIARAKLRRRPWRRTAPGAFRLSTKWAAEFYRESLATSQRVAELEAEILVHQADARRAEAEAAALDLLLELDREHVIERVAADELPMTGDGRLHEAAFRVLVDAQIWKHREHQLATVLGTTTD